MPDRDETTVLKFMAKVETINAIASIAMTVGLLLACLLLDRNYNQLALLEHALKMRNDQGTRSLALAEERNRQGEEQLRLLERAVQQLQR